jgi:hypothetical protein
MRPHLRAANTLLAGLLTLSVASLVMNSSGASGGVVAARATTTVVTPGNFTGYGFDQCHTPDQSAMDTWLEYSPFLAVGVYLSGDSRACRDQPNLTPDWVSTQLAKGWRLLPITLGPQASCSTRFPRYGTDKTINPNPTNTYSAARSQGWAEAGRTVDAATALGIAPGSTLWYDIEAFDATKTACRESALWFLSAWTAKLHKVGFQSGVYSSAGSGIKVLDDARVQRPTTFNLPDYIWIARWDQEASTRTEYIPDDGWNPHRRVKQYQGGHNETWGGVTINIDRNFLDVGTGTQPVSDRVFCGGAAKVDWYDYPTLRPGSTRAIKIKTLQCLLTDRRLYGGPLNGVFNRGTLKAANAWQTRKGLTVSPTWDLDDWTTLLSFGRAPISKIGSTSRAVRRLQRVLNAALDTRVEITGVFDATTAAALRSWQAAHNLTQSGVANTETWAAIQAGTPAS